MFNCNKCGLCCQNIRGIELYKELDDGTGVCKYYDKSTSLCKIYSDRPLICRIDDAYEAFFKDEITLEEYYELNYYGCSKLKNKE